MKRIAILSSPRRPPPYCTAPRKSPAIVCCTPIASRRTGCTYSGDYAGQRYSLLDQITPANVKNLELKWVFQARSLEKFETTPLVVDGIMYLTEAPNHVVRGGRENRAHFLGLRISRRRTTRACAADR